MRFGRIAALKDVSFRAGAGERIAVVGRNGAGKTTLLRVLSTFLTPDSGSASICGFDVFTQAESVRALIGYLPENAPLDPDQRVAEYLRFRGMLRSMPRPLIRRRIHEVADACGISLLRDSSIGALSCGQRHMVGLADALLHEPDVLLLDDPLAASDPAQRECITRMLASPGVSAGRAVIFATHSEELVRSAATRLLFIDRGTIVKDVGDPAKALAGRSLQECFTRWRREATEVSP